MDKGLKDAGHALGVTEDDVKALQRRRIIKAALFGALPVFAFFIGYLLRKTVYEDTSTELPTSTYPYIAAATLASAPLSKTLAPETSKRFTGAGVLALSAAAFVVGYLIPDLVAAYEPMVPRYGVLSR